MSHDSHPYSPLPPEQPTRSVSYPQIPTYPSNAAPAYPPNMSGPLASPSSASSGAAPTQPTSTPAAAVANDDRYASAKPPQSPAAVTLNLRTLSGQVMSITFPTLAYVTILDVKRRLEEVHNIPVSFQRLIFSGREVIDTEYASNYGIENGAMIHLLLRQVNNGNSNDSDSNANVNPESFEFNGFPIPIAPAAEVGNVSIIDQERLSKVAQYSRIIKMLALIDVLWLLIWAIQVSFYFSFGCVMAIAGYIGAVHYRRDFIAVFAVFLILSMATRIYIMVYIGEISTYILLSLGVFLDIYLFTLVLKFFRMCSSLSPFDRAELMALSAPAFGAFS